MREPILKYYDIALNVTAFSTTRHGGFSEGSYGAFNINPYCGDDTQHVMQNQELLCKKLGIKPRDLIFPHQTHDIKVKFIDKDFLFMTNEEKKKELEGIDALVTKEKRICIGVSTADCVPLLFYDAEKEISAAVHAGWRGTKDGIVVKTWAYMLESFSCKPENLCVVVGPCISQDAFEVDEDVCTAFSDAGFCLGEIAEKRGEKWHVDLVKANVGMLLQYGIRKDNIQCSGICTFQNNTDFFSARKQTIHSGRIFTGIIMR